VRLSDARLLRHDGPPCHDGLEGLLTFFSAWAKVFLYVPYCCCRVAVLLAELLTASTLDDGRVLPFRTGGVGRKILVDRCRFRAPTSGHLCSIDHNVR
jgi:hypothetical protein